MDINLKNRCDLFVENRKKLADMCTFGATYVTYAAALLHTASGMEVDVDYANQCKKIIKSNTSTFSEFRGNVMQPLICKMMLSDDPENYLEKVKKVVEILREIKWIGDSYRILAAMAICDYVEESEFEKYVTRTVDVYQRMKKNHNVLTGAEDVPFAALLAVSDIEIDKLVNDMEDIYKILKTKFDSSDAAQSLSHVLCLNPSSIEEKCDRVFKIFDELKTLKHKYGTGYELASLGTLTMLDLSETHIAGTVAEVDDYLKQQKCFGNISLGAKERRILAGQIVLQNYGIKDIGANSAILASMLALTIATEVSIMLCITVCMTTTVNN